MQAEDDQRRVERAHDHAFQPAHILAQEGEQCGEDLANVITQRSEDGESQNTHDDELDHRNEYQTDGLGHDLVQPLFQRSLHQHDQHDGNGGVGIADKVERDAEEGHRFTSGHKASPRCMAHNACHDHTQHWVAAQLLSGGIGQQDGHEGEGCIAKQVQQHIHLTALVNPAEGHPQCQQSLDHTGTGQCGHDGREDAGNKIGDDIKNFLFASRLVGFGSSFCIFRLRQQLDHLFIALGYIQTDDHLKHTAFGKAFGVARQLLNGCAVCFGIIAEFEPQTGLAMVQGVHIFRAAHKTNDVLCDRFILFTHDDFSFLRILHRSVKLDLMCTCAQIHFSLQENCSKFDQQKAIDFVPRYTAHFWAGTVFKRHSVAQLEYNIKNQRAQPIGHALWLKFQVCGFS